MTLRPKLSSSRFSDYKKAALDSVEISLQIGETKQVTIETGPFIIDEIQQKHYALGRGEYFVESVSMNDAEDKDIVLI